MKTDKAGVVSEARKVLRSLAYAKRCAAEVNTAAMALGFSIKPIRTSRDIDDAMCHVIVEAER